MEITVVLMVAEAGVPGPRVGSRARYGGNYPVQKMERDRVCRDRSSGISNTLSYSSSVLDEDRSRGERRFRCPGAEGR